jgi:nitrate/TMAO reductase-like tetraheme cytochrome c subunit
MDFPLAVASESHNAPTYALLAFGLLTIGLIILVVRRPSLTGHRIGQSLIFLAFLPLPGLFFVQGLERHIELSKRTEFCISCHVMRPYGKSLLIDDQDYLPAAHFQNRRIPADEACFTCHTSYTMYGDWMAKFRGLRHTWVNYLGTVPDQPQLYDPYLNRECLHCHVGARSFEENEMHVDVRAELESDEISCLECHDLIHSTETLCAMPTWSKEDSAEDGAQEESE